MRCFYIHDFDCQVSLLLNLTFVLNKDLFIHSLSLRRVRFSRPVDFDITYVRT